MGVRGGGLWQQAKYAGHKMGAAGRLCTGACCHPPPQTHPFTHPSAGISIITAGLLAQLPASCPADAGACQAALAAAKPQLDALLQLLQAAGLTLADGLLER